MPVVSVAGVNSLPCFFVSWGTPSPCVRSAEAWRRVKGNFGTWVCQRLLLAPRWQFQLEHASLVSAAVPATDDLWELTSRVAANNGYLARPSDGDAAGMQFLHSK